MLNDGHTANAGRLAKRERVVAIALLTRLWLTGLPEAGGSGGITVDEGLLRSNAVWHRAQRKRVAFETSCYYTYDHVLPYGCQRGREQHPAWREDPVRQGEREALVDFYYAMNGDNWLYKDNWHDDAEALSDPCWDTWYGVTCNEHGYVIALELADNRLRGYLPSYTFERLTYLLKLDLSSTMPAYHSHPNPNINRIRGVLPSLATATQLEEIEVSGNLLTALPEDLDANAPKLRVLSANNNRLIRLPQNLGVFRSLHTLELGNNRIQSAFPSDAFGSLTSARFVQLEYNDLQGEISEEIVGMRRVRAFDVSHNPSLGGTLPQSVIVEWTENEYVAILNTTLVGYIAQLCIDVPFCWKYMYDTHRDLSWAIASEVPDIVNITMELALAHARESTNRRLHKGARPAQESRPPFPV